MMTPETFAQTIVSIERNHGLRLDARSVWLRMDATPCGRGWVGTKPPGCKRPEKGVAVQPSNKSTKSPKTKPDKPAVLPDKPVEAIVKAKTRTKKSKTLKVDPKVELKSQQSTPQTQPVKSTEVPIVPKLDPKVEKPDDVIVKKLTEEDGSPKSFSTTIGGKQIVMGTSALHSPTWSQNNDGITVSGNKSRRFVSHGSASPYSLDPSQFKSFVEKIRQDPAYSKVEEFNLGDSWNSKSKEGKDSLAKLKALESAGLVSLTNPEGSAFHGVVINFDSKGKIRKATDAEIASIPLRANAFKLREDQSEMIKLEHSDDMSHKPDPSQIREIRAKETALAGKVVEAEDKLYGRKNTKTATEAEYITKAEAWAKSQGFKNDGDGVNGFSAKQAAKHDIAHPATHDLVGLDSAGIHSYFGGLKTASGKKSLLGEEAIVNVTEHLSRGDTLESSVMSGVRVARMLSRDSTKQERDYVRSPKFLQDLNSLGEKALRANNFGTISKVVRESNWDSGTVTRSGNT